MLQKLSAGINALTWFEIPVKDMERARKFYETILDIKMELLPPDKNATEETMFFPRLPDTVMALSGIVSGALVKAERLSPSDSGTLVYLNASPSVQAVIDRVGPAGGKIVKPRTKIPAGYIAVFIDTEGNQLALHAAE